MDDGRFGWIRKAICGRRVRRKKEKEDQEGGNERFG